MMGATQSALAQLTPVTPQRPHAGGVSLYLNLPNQPPDGFKGWWKQKSNKGHDMRSSGMDISISTRFGRTPWLKRV
jgi:hypothetical protein